MSEITFQPHFGLFLTERHRETYEGATRLLPELPILGRMHLAEAIPNALNPDRHPGEYELHHVVSGTMNVWVGDRTYEVAPGSTFLTQPDQLHGGVDATLQPGEWYWLRLRFPPSDRPLPELSLTTTRKLKRGLAAINKPVPARAALRWRDCFDRLLREHRQPTTHSPLMSRLILHEMIVTLCRDAEAMDAAPGAAPGDDEFLSPQIRRAVEWIDKNLAEQLPSIDDIALQVGLSESHFRRRFHEETGFSPVEYVTRQRVLRAKQLLRDKSLSITRLAFELGFQSSGYFTQVFRKLTGMTPSEYRNRY